MSDQPPDSRPVLPPDTGAASTQSLPAEQSAGGGQPAAPPARERLQDRLWSLRAVIAVALASVLLGGLGGAALAVAANGSDDHPAGPGRFQRGGPGAPPGMDGRQRDRMGQWHDQRGMGQRQWGQNGGPPGLPPGGLPTAPSASPSP